MGRPTKYKPEYCDHLIAQMGKGFSMTAVAGSMGVAKSTLFYWAQNYPDFSDALKKGEAVRLLFWEERLVNDGGTPAATIFALKNCGPEEWRDRKLLDHTSSDASMTPKLNVAVLSKEEAEAGMAAIDRARDAAK